MYFNKKIVVVATEFFAVDYFLGPIINEISKKNQIYILTNNISNNTRKLHLNTNINIINFNIVRKPNLFNDLFSLIFLFKFFFNKKNFVVLSITPKALFLVALCKFLLFKSFNNINFITGQIWTNKNFFIKKLFKIIDYFVFKLASYNLVDSKSQIQYLVSEGYDKKQFNLIHNGSICGVNLNLFNFNKHFLNNDFINIIFVGRLNREKGLFLLIDEFLNLKKKYKFIRLNLIGNIEDQKLDKLIKKNLKNDIYFISANANNPEFYLKQSDIFCIPSFREGFGLSVIEASACGLPVVTSNIYGLNDCMINEITGLKFDLNDSKNLYYQLEKLITSPKLRMQLGKNGSDFVKKYFNQNDVVTFILNILKKIV